MTDAEQQCHQSQEVAKLTTIFNQLSQAPLDENEIDNICTTTDLDIREDLELNSVPPSDIINEYINDVVIQIDAEDELAYDMGEDENCTLEKELSVLLPNILHLQHLASQYLTNEYDRDQALKALRTLSQSFVKQVRVKR